MFCWYSVHCVTLYVKLGFQGWCHSQEVSWAVCREESGIEAVCSVRLVAFPVKTFPQRGRAEHAEGQQFTMSRTDIEHPASWMLAFANPQPWRPKMGLQELLRPLHPTLPLPPLGQIISVVYLVRHHHFTIRTKQIWGVQARVHTGHMQYRLLLWCWN